jgi:hypothetical protein
VRRAGPSGSAVAFRKAFLGPLGDPRGYGIHIRQYIIVGDSQYDEPFCFDHGLAVQVPGQPAVMTSSVHLNDKASLRTVEVYDETADGLLPEKAYAERAAA